MTYTMDHDTDIGRVRVLVPGEGVESTSVFSDEDIQVMLDVNSSVVYLAAAAGLERIAADQVLLLKKVKVSSIQVDGPAVSDALLRLALSYRNAYETGSGAAADDFQVAGMNVSLWTHRELLWNDWLRTVTA